VKNYFYLPIDLALALAGYIVKLDNLQFLAIIILSLGMLYIAMQFKINGLKIYDEVYKEDITKQSIE